MLSGWEEWVDQNKTWHVHIRLILKDQVGFGRFFMAAFQEIRVLYRAAFAEPD